jgi:hypothetical protein
MRFDLELRVHGLEGLRVAASITPTLTSGARLNHVPLRGGGQAMNDLVAGHLPWMMANAHRPAASCARAASEGSPLPGPGARPLIPIFRPSPRQASQAMPEPHG